MLQNTLGISTGKCKINGIKKR